MKELARQIIENELVAHQHSGARDARSVEHYYQRVLETGILGLIGPRVRYPNEKKKLKKFTPRKIEEVVARAERMGFKVQKTKLKKPDGKYLHELSPLGVNPEKRRDFEELVAEVKKAHLTWLKKQVYN